MATSSFYNDNLFRAYPFVASEPVTPFPVKRIVGAKVYCFCGSAYESFPSVYLSDWKVLPQEHRLTFVSAAGTIRTLLPITIPKKAERFEHFFSPVVNETQIRITVGDLAGATESFSDLKLFLEPTCTIWMKHRGVRSVRFGNATRPRLPSCLYEGQPVSYQRAYTTAEWWVQDAISGAPLLLSEGCNCSLMVSAIDNKIHFSPRAYAGTGEVSEFVSLGSTPVDDELLPEIPVDLDDVPVRPDGLPFQDHILCSFCGATGPEISLAPTRTVRIENDPENLSVLSIVVERPGPKGC